MATQFNYTAWQSPCYLGRLTVSGSLKETTCHCEPCVMHGVRNLLATKKNF
ncbi:MAG: hypothetical protein IJV35_01820 [Neisseriaceae bacterium]|nr:hypothetical protein [Neisseriaceae bacterium]